MGTPEKGAWISAPSPASPHDGPRRADEPGHRRERRNDEESSCQEAEEPSGDSGRLAAPGRQSSSSEPMKDGPGRRSGNPEGQQPGDKGKPWVGHPFRSWTPSRDGLRVIFPYPATLRKKMITSSSAFTIFVSSFGILLKIYQARHAIGINCQKSTGKKLMIGTGSQVIYVLE